MCDFNSYQDLYFFPLQKLLTHSIKSSVNYDDDDDDDNNNNIAMMKIIIIFSFPRGHEIPGWRPAGYN